MRRYSPGDPLDRGGNLHPAGRRDLPPGTVSDEEEVLREARPSWWNFFWHWVFFWLVIPVIVALWKRASLLLRVYEDRVVLERGVLSKNIKVVFITDIRTIDIRQSLVQRVLKIGTVMIATAGTSGYEDVAGGLPDPKGIKDLILRLRRKSTRGE